MYVRNQFATRTAHSLEKYNLNPEQKKRVLRRIVEDLDEFLLPDKANLDEEIEADLIQSKQIELGLPVTEDDVVEYYDVHGNPILRWGRTELHQAVESEDIETIKELLSKSVDMSIKDNGDKTAYQRALILGNEEIIQLLKE